jgi:O-antigen ligase
MSAFVMILAWGFSGKWHEKLATLIEKPAALWITALVAWMYLSILWSEGSTESILYAANVQWQLLLIPIIITLAIDDRWIDKCWKAFAIGMTVLILHIYLMQVISIPWVYSTDPACVFFNALPQSIGLAIFSAWCIREFICSFKSNIFIKLLLIFLFVASTYSIFQVSQQRLGYLSWLLGCSVVLFLHLRSQIRWMALASMLVLFCSIIFISPKIQARFEQAKLDVQSYDYKNNYTSIGMRLHMWTTGINSVFQSPVIGHGLGSYPIVSSNNFKDRVMCEVACRHPHNQYIFYALEYGFVGLFLFLLFLKSIFLRLRSSDKFSVLPWVVVCILVSASFAESTLWYRGFMYLFVPLLAISSAVNPRKD